MLGQANPAPSLRRLYRDAVLSLWAWVGRALPDSCFYATSFDALVSEFVEHGRYSGSARSHRGNAGSTSLCASPELWYRGSHHRESWCLLNARSRIEVPSMMPPLPTAIAGLPCQNQFCKHKLSFRRLCHRSRPQQLLADWRDDGRPRERRAGGTCGFRVSNLS